MQRILTIYKIAVFTGVHNGSGGLDSDFTIVIISVYSDDSQETVYTIDILTHDPAIRKFECSDCRSAAYETGEAGA